MLDHAQQTRGGEGRGGDGERGREEEKECKGRETEIGRWKERPKTGGMERKEGRQRAEDKRGAVGGGD